MITYSHVAPEVPARLPSASSACSGSAPMTTEAIARTTASDRLCCSGCCSAGMLAGIERKPVRLTWESAGGAPGARTQNPRIKSGLVGRTGRATCADARCECPEGTHCTGMRLVAVPRVVPRPPDSRARGPSPSVAKHRLLTARVRKRNFLAEQPLAPAVAGVAVCPGVT